MATTLDEGCKVWVVSSNLVIRAGLKTVFDRHGFMASVYEDLPIQPISRPELCPDVVIYDCSPSRWKTSGVKVWSQIFCRHVPIVLYFDRALSKPTANTTINGQIPESALVGIVRQAMQGADHDRNPVRRRAVRRIRKGKDPLSPREREVLNLIGRGMSNLRVAQSLYLSVKTVETHIENIKRKLNHDSVSTLREVAVASRLADRVY
jgi:DNA-binding NarL/FixJ family response regulator